MKLSKIILIALLITASLSQNAAATTNGGSCQGGCVSCRTNGEVEWCLACLNSKHEMTTAINGKCTGDKSPVSDCMISFAWGSSQLCSECNKGFAKVVKGIAANGDITRKLEGYSCKKIQDANALTGIWITQEASTDEYFYAYSCKYGYKVEAISKGGSTCQPNSSSNIAYDENCYDYSSSSCNKCKDNYVKVNGRCHIPIMNSGEFHQVFNLLFLKNGQCQEEEKMGSL